MSAETPRPDAEVKSFEASFDELEAIVRRLEGGSLSLDESLAHYEHGVAALKRCYRILDQAEKRLEVLVRESDGALVTRAVDLAEARGEARGGARIEPLRPEPARAESGRLAVARAEAPRSAREDGRALPPARGREDLAACELPPGPPTSTSTSTSTSTPTSNGPAPAHQLPMLPAPAALTPAPSPSPGPATPGAPAAAARALPASGDERRAASPASAPAPRAPKSPTPPRAEEDSLTAIDAAKAAPAPGIDGALAAIAAEVEAALGRLLPAEADEPRELHRAMRYSALGAGKRVRPALVLLGADLHGVPRDEAMPLACAYECVHVYSLIHDDLPAMDDDDLRRGKPTSHKVFGEALAILAGDALLTYAFELAARSARHASALVRDLAEVAGARGMVGGQVLDVRNEGKTPERPTRDRATLERIHRWKTAALIRGAARAGAILAGVDPGPLTRYGEAVGLAFQVVDDILDVEATTEALGKTAGKDAASGKLTYPSLYGLPAAKAEAARLIAEAREALADAPAGEARGLLLELADLVRDRRK